jgi:hypothetical protein
MTTIIALFLIAIGVIAFAIAYTLSVIISTIKHFHELDEDEIAPEGQEFQTPKVTRFIAML